MTTINIKTESPRENWTFLYSFFAFSLITLALTLNMFALPGPYKIAIFYAGFLLLTLPLLNRWLGQKFTLAWYKTEKGALKFLALL